MLLRCCCCCYINRMEKIVIIELCHHIHTYTYTNATQTYSPHLMRHSYIMWRWLTRARAARCVQSCTQKSKRTNEQAHALGRPCDSGARLYDLYMIVIEQHTRTYTQTQPNTQLHKIHMIKTNRSQGLQSFDRPLRTSSVSKCARARDHNVYIERAALSGLTQSKIYCVL